MKTKVLYSNGYFKKQAFFMTNWNWCFSNKKISNAEILAFFQSVCEFFIIYKNIVKCLEASLHSIHNGRLELISIINLVKKGVPLSKAFENSGVFSKMIINIIRAGEKNDDLFGSFKLVVEFLDNERKRKSKFFKVLFYPLFTFGMFFITVFLFSRCIIPALIELVNELNSDMLSRFILVKNILFGMEIFFFSFLIINLFSYILYKYDSDLFEKICFRLPIIKNLFIYSNLYFLSYYMEISLKNNLSLEEALDVAIFSSNFMFRKILSSVKYGLFQGRELSDCFINSKLIPTLFIDIIKTGEKSNSLKNAFATTSQLFKSKYEGLIERMIILSPIILITLISTLLIIFVCFLLFPLYNLGS